MSTAGSEPIPAVPSPDTEGDAPVGPNDRLAILDVLRGLALFGVLISNLQFHLKGPLLHPAPLPSWSSDQWVLNAVGALFEAKFYPLFSFLFGYGAFVMYRRAKARGGNFDVIFGRRMIGLIGLGIIHGLFFFDGDILFSYGVAGLLLLLFVRTSVTVMISAAVVYWLIQLLVTASGQLVSAQLDPALATTTYDSYLGDLYYRASAVVLAIPGLFVSGWLVVAMFLLGAATSRLGWLEVNSPAARRFLRILRGPVLVVGLVLGLTGGWLQEGGTGALETVGRMLNLVGGPFIGLAIIGWTMQWLSTRPEEGTVRRHLRSMGRMSLTAYLAQSVLALLVFSNAGLQLRDHVPYTAAIPIAVAIYVVIALFCEWWMRRFRFGPVEWVLRTWTYNAPQEIRR